MTIRTRVLGCCTALALSTATAGYAVAQQSTGGAAEDEPAVQTEDVAAADLEPLTFSPGQAVAGRLNYQRLCAACHGDDLGGGAAPELVGGSFSYWVGRPVSDLHEYIYDFMPADAPRSLEPAQVTTIIAYLAEQNDLEAGGDPLPIEVDQQGNIAFAQ